MKRLILAMLLVLMLLLTNLSLGASAEESGDPESGVSNQQEGNAMTADGDSDTDTNEGGNGTDGTGEGGIGTDGAGEGSTGTGDTGEGDTDTGDTDDGDTGTGDAGEGSTGTGGNDETGTGNNGTGGNGDAACEHVWVYVEINPTCTEYGGKGYGCGLCGAVKDIVVIDLAAHTYDNSCDTDCNVCKATREIKHKFSSQWSKNSTKHWHACTVCGEKDGEGDHYPGPAATEEKAQYCLTCGLMMMPQKSHTHTYAKKFTTDETGHWYACSGCDEKKDFQMHTYDNLCDPDCNDCGFTTQTAHSYGDNWSFDETGHWNVCVLCQDVKESQAHIPGPEATDLTAQLCTVCGYEIAPALTHIHTPGKDWTADEVSHWKTCECGEMVEKAIHNWDDGTEEDHGLRFVCQDCSAEKMEAAAEEKEGGFPWGIVLAVLVVVMIGAIVGLVIVLFGGKKKKGKFHR